MNRFLKCLSLAAVAFCAAGITFGLMGCVDALQSKFAYSDKIYEGPFRDRSQIALLVQHEDQRAHVVEIDGVRLKEKLGVIFELLPGSHDIGLSYVKIKGNTIYRSKFDQYVRFNTLAGHTYEFDGTLMKGLPVEKWSPSIHDITKALERPERAKFKAKIDNILLNARAKDRSSR